MYTERYRSFVLSKLMQGAQADGIVGDVFPEAVKPTHCIQVNYDGFAWLGAYGHGIAPEAALYSPSVSIQTDHEDERLYSLLLIDLDRPNPLSNQYEQWAHWFV